MTSEPILNPDFRDLLASLHGAGAEHLVVGGFAVAAWGFQRATKDLDVFIRPDPENARRVLEALSAFGAPLFGVTAEELAAPGLILQLGVPPRRIDVMNRIEGVDFDAANAQRLLVKVTDLAIPVIGLAALLKNKRATGRPEDLRDVRKLERIAAQRRS